MHSMGCLSIGSFVVISLVIASLGIPACLPGNIYTAEYDIKAKSCRTTP